jgi:hypothetical protein
MAESTKASAGWVGGTDSTWRAAPKRVWSSVAMTIGEALWAR